MKTDDHGSGPSLNFLFHGTIEKAKSENRKPPIQRLTVQMARLFVLNILILPFWSLGQNSPYSTLKNVAPPSPEAISFARQNFSDVNLYTGKHSYSIPLYTISQNGIDFPITLSYTGGGGIKVEEVASSVGLGWSLQYTGVVTRSVKGIADDTNSGYFQGYMHLPGVDSTLFDQNYPNWSLIHESYRNGKYDGQPDTYFINAPGLSATFYINKLKQIVFVEKSDMQVKMLMSGTSISGFEITDLNGNVYVFDITETNLSVALNTPNPTEYNLYDVSSWYLSKILDPNRKTVFNFLYQDKEQNHTNQLIRSPYQYTVDNQFQFDEDNSTYTELHNKRPLLQKIITASGEVDFIASGSTRYDLANDRSIDSIKVRNYLGEAIRSFNFDYSYFSSSGTIQEGQGQYYGNGDPSLRLKLDALEIIGGNDPSLKEVYSFVYNTSHLLPDRLSTFAMDHWGYYNGVTTNTSWEAKHREMYYDFGGQLDSVITRLEEFGTANREPNSAYAQACILHEVKTPMGGTVQFEYEGHTSNNPDLPNNVSSIFSEYTLDNQNYYFNINLIREPFSYVRITALVDQSVSIEYTLSDSLEMHPPIVDTLVVGSNNHIYKLQSGSYYIRARFIGTPNPENNYAPRLFKDVETLIMNKPVGGLRIKKMVLTDPVTGQTHTRKYYYNEEGSSNALSPSTGVISRVPKNGYQNIVLFDSDYDINYWSTTSIAQPMGYVRQLSSTYPLITSSGSYCAYSKVTTVDSDDLKSEYHFTTFNEFPELADGYYTSNSLYSSEFENGGAVFNNKWYEFFPFAPNDERDFYRGKLIKEVSYKKEDQEFKKVSVKQTQYAFNYGTMISKDKIAVYPYLVTDFPPILPDTVEFLPVESIDGIIVTIPSDCSECSQLKRYRLYTGKYDLGRTTQTTYNYSGSQVDSLVSKSNLEYGQSPWSRDSLYHYVVTKVIQQTNIGADTTLLYYPFDWRYSNTEINVADTSFLRTLEKQNRIGMPFLEKKKRNATHIVTTKNLYSNFNTNQLNPAVIQVKSGVQSAFENRMSFTAYDTLGNILEQQKAADVTTSYIWGYRGSYPIAQVVNAPYDKIAYTSFESDNTGNWNFSGTGQTDITAPTGANSYSLSGNVTKSGLGTGSYIVSYWKKLGTITVNGSNGAAGETINGWTYYQHLINDPSNGIISVAGSAALIDELRLYPVSAQMTTYTYKPLIGVTSQCDPNNFITHYEYDSFGRLTLVKDNKGNIVKNTVYNIQTQTGQQ